MTIRTSLVALAASACLITPAFAQDMLPAPIQSAFDKIEAQPVSDREDWRFTLTFRLEDEELVGRYDGTLAEDERWTLVSHDEASLEGGLAEVWSEFTTEDEDDSNGLFFDPEEIGFLSSSLELVDETADDLTYGFVLDEAQAEGEDAEFVQYLRGELHLDRDEEQVRRMRLYAPESFKPNFAVRVREFEMVQEYSDLEGAPLPVLTRMSQTIRASAMMQSFEQVMVLEFSDIEYLAE